VVNCFGVSLRQPCRRKACGGMLLAMALTVPCAARYAANITIAQATGASGWAS
jgi:hypothetical protein